MKQRKIETRVAPSGAALAVVPVGRDDKKVAVLYWEDYEALLAKGFSGNFHKMGKSVGVYDPSKRQQDAVARLILNAKAGEKGAYLDGDRLNLRRENLKLIPGFSIKDSFVDPLASFEKLWEAS